MSRLVPTNPPVPASWRSCPSVWTNQRRARVAAVAVAAASSQLVPSLLYKPISARRRAFTRLTLSGKWVQQIETCSSETEREQNVWPLPHSLTHFLWLTTLQTRNRNPPHIWERNKQLAKSPQTAKKETFFCFKERTSLWLSKHSPSELTFLTRRVVDQEFKADFQETISGTKLRVNEENKLEKYLIQRTESGEFLQQTNTNVNIDKIV